MTRPADITLSDEIKSLQLYLSIEFPADEIRRSKPLEDEPYDMLIDASSETLFEARGGYLSDSTMPLTIQRWCDSHDMAMEYCERIQRLLKKGKRLYVSGERTAASPTISNIASTAGVEVGMAVEGHGIPAGTKVSAKTSTTITMSADATVDSTGVLTVSYKGGRSRVPVWKWSGTAPDAAIDTPDRYMRVEDVSVRILPADEPTKYVAVCDVRLRGWRVTWEHTDQLVEEVTVGPDLSD